MRGWIIALSVLGIATAGAGSLIGERSYVASAIDWNDVDFEERELAGRLMNSRLGMVASGQVATALADAPSVLNAREEPPEAETEAAAAAGGAGANVPSITEETAPEPEPPKVVPAAEPAPAAPAPRREPVQAARPVAPAPTTTLAVECMAGCGPKKIVFQAVPVSSRPERIGGMMHAAVINNDPPGPVKIECLAGCYGSTPRSYGAPQPVRVTAASHADVAYEYLPPRVLHNRRGTSVQIHRGTRSQRVPY